ncbi:MAG: hypothetical protein WDZ30_03055 [Cellvibrionaceae bacterium]
MAALTKVANRIPAQSNSKGRENVKKRLVSLAMSVLDDEVPDYVRAFADTVFLDRPKLKRSCPLYLHAIIDMCH